MLRWFFTQSDAVDVIAVGVGVVVVAAAVVVVVVITVVIVVFTIIISIANRSANLKDSWKRWTHLELFIL